MPSYEYQCEADILPHTIVKFYRSFGQAAPFIDEVVCEEHKQIAKRVPSMPLQAALYGNPEGYHKPSPTKRHNTKLVNEHTGNKWATG